MDQQDIVNKDEFETQEYLSPAQIEIVKARKEEPISNQNALLDLIDGFVRSNGKADAKYEAMLKTARDASALFGCLADYPQPVQQTVPLLFGLLYWDFLMLVGVISEQDVEDMKKKAMAGMGMSQADDWSNKA